MTKDKRGAVEKPLLHHPPTKKKEGRSSGEAAPAPTYDKR
jgi:hypothetical protein